ncbi:putative reverse transcriptase domain-containing protein [Tanacetum coccineum]
MTPRVSSSILKKVQDFVEELHDVHKVVHENLVRANSKYKQDADHKRRHVNFEEGDFVWAILTKDRFLVGEYNKLSAKKIGLLEIVEKINSNAYRLKLPSHIRCSDVFNVKHLVPYHGDSSDDDLAMNSRTNFVYPEGTMEAQNCRIIVGWDSDVVDVILLSSHGQVMHFEVSLIIDKRKFFVSFIYGENDPKDRLGLWENLNDHMVFTDNKPLLMLGDFNAILYSEDHSKGFANIYQTIREFRSCVQQLGMEYLARNGLFFTWVQKRKDLESGIMKKLDRVIGNSDLFDMFGACYVNFLPYITSDHCHALLVIPCSVTKRKRSFRFMNYLTDKKEFHQVVKENWNVPINGKIDADSALYMVRDVTNEEIKLALFDIDDNKAPDLDGFTSRFFKASWGTIGKDFCTTIKEFFSSASFSICLNGESHGFFKDKRGLRQGDTVSPYLFTIIMEVFTLMLRRQKSNRKRKIGYIIALKEVCMQKSEGGLGLKSIHVWNEALMAKHLWNVVISKDSIWVKWV